jgi:transposase-like protein
MGKTNRNEPKRAASSESTATLFEFERRFPDDATCLDWLVGHLYPEGMFCPKCEKVTRHYRVAKRTCYECQFCGHQEYPMRGTIFEGSSTSLRLWFYAIYLMASTRCGISAKQLEREIGVSYPTAHRMFKQIRTLLGQEDDPLSGTVEMDEAYIGGDPRWMHANDPRKQRRGRGTAKTPVFGMAQRAASGEQGRVVAKVIEGVAPSDLIPPTRERVLPGSVVYTDEWAGYGRLGREGYRHSRIPHAAKVYVDGDVHVNTIEGFWALVKGGLRGVYHGVSVGHLQSYLDEYVYRYNSRENPVGMFDAFLNRISKASPASPDPS